MEKRHFLPQQNAENQYLIVGLAGAIMLPAMMMIEIAYGTLSEFS